MNNTSQPGALFDRTVWSSIRRLAVLIAIHAHAAGILSADERFPASSYLIVARHSGYGLDVRGAGGELADVQTAGFGEQTNRCWTISPTDSGFYNIAAVHSGLFLDVRHDGGELAVIQTAGKATQINREFALAPTGDGFYVITGLSKGLSFDVKMAGGWLAVVQTAGNGGQTNREWLVIPSDFRAPKYADPHAEFYRLGVAAFLKEPCNFDFIHYDQRLIVRVPAEFLQAKLKKFVEDDIPALVPEIKNPVFESLTLNQDGLRVRVRITDPFQGWAVLCATATAWPGKSPTIHVRLAESRADEGVQEAIKALTDFDGQVNEKVMPGLSAKMNEVLGGLPFWPAVQLVGLQSDGVICVLSPGAKLRPPAMP